MMKPGVYIEKGLSDWQILQHREGRASATIQGVYVESDDFGKPQTVLSRVVREESYETTIHWTACEMLPDMKWKATLSLPKGGLYRIETCLKPVGIGIEYSLRGDMIHHVGVGELFAITGQSNSAGYGKDPVFDPPEVGVHILKNSGKWDLATHPLNDSTGSIHPVNIETINPGHSPYLSFAKYLKRELNCPVGLVQASLGGSSLSQWNPSESGELYRNLLEVIDNAGGDLRAILWYQGCSDTSAGLCDTYLERFTDFLAALRQALNSLDLPLFTVQLNRFVADQEIWGMKDEYWAKIREAQRIAAKIIPGVFVVPAIDIPLSDNIHNSSYGNIVLGERLAKQVLKHVFSRDLITDAPDIERATTADGLLVRVEFTNVTERLYAFDLLPGDLPLHIKDCNGCIEIKRYDISGNTIELALARRLDGRAWISNQYHTNPPVYSIIDVISHLPAFSFYDFEIEWLSEESK